jgi:hypothetical protein
MSAMRCASAHNTVMQNNGSSSTCLRDDATKVRRTSSMKAAYIISSIPAAAYRDGCAKLLREKSIGYRRSTRRPRPNTELILTDLVIGDHNAALQDRPEAVNHPSHDVPLRRTAPRALTAFLIDQHQVRDSEPSLKGAYSCSQRLCRSSARNDTRSILSVRDGRPDCPGCPDFPSFFPPSSPMKTRQRAPARERGGIFPSNFGINKGSTDPDIGHAAGEHWRSARVFSATLQGLSRMST